MINVPKKYQYRGKRLNIDSQSITSTKQSQITSESIKNHQFLHTKSGPIQTQDTLEHNQNHITQEKSLKLMDYRFKGINSPSNTAKVLFFISHI